MCSTAFILCFVLFCQNYLLNNIYHIIILFAIGERDETNMKLLCNINMEMFHIVLAGFLSIMN